MPSYPLSARYPLHPKHEKNRRFEARGHYFPQSSQGRSADRRYVQNGGGNHRSLDAFGAGDFIEGKTEWHRRRVALEARALLPGDHLLGWIYDFEADFNSPVMFDE